MTRPTRTMRWLNFALFQAGWFAVVLGAAHAMALAGTLVAATVVVWHLAVSARPAVEARLVACALLIGALWVTFCVQLGQVRFASGQPSSTPLRR